MNETSERLRELADSTESQCNSRIRLYREAAALIDLLQLERDVLALNWSGKDSSVVVVWHENRPLRVGWASKQSASEPVVKLPSYHEDKPDNDGLPEGIWYGGKGIGGEYYTKEVDALNSHSIWMEGTESWTPEELEAIARHKRKLNSQNQTEQQP